MCLIAVRVSVLACVVAGLGAWLHAAPLVWTSVALALVAVAALVATLAGVTP